MSADAKHQNHTIRNCQFVFKCPMSWNDLAPVESDGESVRFCDHCRKNVYFCETDDQLVQAIKENRCVAIDIPEQPADVPGRSYIQSKKLRNPRGSRALVGLPSDPGDYRLKRD